MPEFLDLFGRTSKVLRVAAEAGMRRHGLYLGQNFLLAALWNEDGGTPGEIAATLNVTTPAVVKMATRLTEAGLLARRPDGQDGRLVRLWLTEEGRALQKPIEAERRSLEEWVTADLTEAERRQLLNALSKIHRSASRLLSH